LDAGFDFQDEQSGLCQSEAQGFFGSVVCGGELPIRLTSHVSRQPQRGEMI